MIMGSEKEKKLLFRESDINIAVGSIVDSILSEFTTNTLPEIAIIGIQSRGVPFAKRLVNTIMNRTNHHIQDGTIDISMFRDDIGLRKSLPTIKETLIPFDLDERIIILADDVLYTGRTIRAALDALTDYGRPALIRLATLVDCNSREFPIRADYTGFTCNVNPGEKIKVHFSETDGEEAIYKV